MKKIDLLIKKYPEIRIYHHINSDGDCLGSAFALYHLIKENYEAKKLLLITNNEKVPTFIDLTPKLIFDKESKVDYLAIIVDTSAPNRIAGESWKNANEMLCIDHHRTSATCIKKENLYVDYKFPSNTMYLYSIVKKLKWKINEAAARNLIMGFITDTGDHLSRGEKNNSLIYFQELTNIYNPSLMLEKIRVNSVVSTELVELILDNLIFKKDFNYVILSKKQYSDIKNITWKKIGRSTNLIQYYNSPKIWFIITENDNKTYNVELRSTGNNPVDKIAKLFGGGGHKNASGAIINKSEIKKMINEIKRTLNQNENWI